MSQRPPRPFLVSLLAWAFLLAGAAGIARLALAVRDWSLLSELPLRPGPFYLAAGGAAWGLLALPAGLALLGGWRWAPHLARVAGAFLLTSYWLDRLVIRLVGTPQPNTLFALGASLLFLALVIAAPALPAARRFFQREESR